MKPITICMTYFRSLTLANLAAALYSVLRQDLSQVEEIVIIDNNTADSDRDIRAVINELFNRIPLVTFLVPVNVLYFKHGDPAKTHAWSTNVAVRTARTPWVLFTRADYLLDFNLLARFTEGLPLDKDWNGFITSRGCHLANPIEECEATSWRADGPRIFRGIEYDYTKVDAGVWMARKDAFDRVGGMDERLSAWGHAQTEFQHRMWKSGVEFVRLDEVLFYHPHHGGERDMAAANRQLEALGLNIHDMWTRYEGANPY